MIALAVWSKARAHLQDGLQICQILYVGSCLPCQIVMQWYVSGGSRSSFMVYATAGKHSLEDNRVDQMGVEFWCHFEFLECKKKKKWGWTEGAREGLCFSVLMCVLLLSCCCRACLYQRMTSSLMAQTSALPSLPRIISSSTQHQRDECQA